MASPQRKTVFLSNESISGDSFVTQDWLEKEKVGFFVSRAPEGQGGVSKESGDCSSHEAGRYPSAISMDEELFCSLGGFDFILLESGFRRVTRIILVMGYLPCEEDKRTICRHFFRS